ncbi:MAG: hypothetical protein ACRYG7_00850 [Janthinobacterium lividum]
MTTLPHLMLQPRSRRSQQRRRRRLFLVVLLGAVLVSGAYLVH